jgi:1,4-alpha-glucan branching enzyme
MPTQPLERQTVLDIDPWLEPQVGAIVHRHNLFRKWKDTLEETEGGYDAFTKGYEKFGLVLQKDNSVVYREWAPNVKEAVLTGDFSARSIFSVIFFVSSEDVVQTSGIVSRTR